MRRWCVLATALALLAPTCLRAADDKPDAERIIGKWLLESSDRKNDIFEGDGQSVQLVFEESKFEFAVLKDGGKILQIPGSYFVDDKPTPKLLDVTLTGDGGTNPVYAIYEFQGEKLRIRIRDNNGPRPADFGSPAEDCQTLTFRRDAEPK